LASFNSRTGLVTSYLVSVGDLDDSNGEVLYQAQVSEELLRFGWIVGYIITRYQL